MTWLGPILKTVLEIANHTILGLPSKAERPRAGKLIAFRQCGSPATIHSAMTLTHMEEKDS